MKTTTDGNRVRRLLLVAGGFTAVAALLSFALPAMQSPAGAAPTSPLLHPIYDCETAKLLGPESPTVEETQAAIVAWSAGAELPAGWQLEDMTGRVSAKVTGFSPSNEVQMAISVIDDPEDLQAVDVFLNSTLVASGSRATGAIVERSGFAYATITVLLPPTYPYTVKVVWDDGAGNSVSQQVLATF